MKINKANLSFAAMSLRSKTELLVLHHAAATKCSVSDVHRWHKGNGWAGIGYHFLVRKDGTIYEGRPLKYVGAHAYGFNNNSIGICFEGNFEKEKMSDAQKEAGKELVAYIKAKFPTIKSVKGHRDLMATACPGKNFPFNEIANVKAKDTKPTTEKPETITVSAAVKAWQNAAIKDGFKFPKYGADGAWGSECISVAKNAICKYRSSGYKYNNLTKIVQKKVGVTADGLFGVQTRAAVISYQKKNDLTPDGCVGLNTWKKILGVK